MNEPTESIRAVEPARIRGNDEAESRSRLWRHESQATMRTMAVVMIDIGVQDALELTTADDQDPVEALAPTVPTKRSASAFACGAWIGRLSRPSWNFVTAVPV